MRACVRAAIVLSASCTWGTVDVPDGVVRDLDASRRSAQASPGASALQIVLAAEGQDARAAGRVPFLYLWGTFCPHCRELNAAVDDPRMREAFRGAEVLRVEVRALGPAMDDPVFGVAERLTVPSFFAIEADGWLATPLTGAAWGEDTPDEMAPAIARYMRDHGVRAPMPSEARWAELAASAPPLPPPEPPPPGDDPLRTVGGIPEGAIEVPSTGPARVFKVPIDDPPP